MTPADATEPPAAGIASHGAPVLVARCDRDSRYTFVNRAYARRFGLVPEQVIGRTIPEVLGAEAFAAIRGYVDAALAGQRVEFEVEVPYDDLGPRVVQAAYEPDVDGAGGVRGLVAVIVDITERRRAEEARQRSDQYLRALIEATPECVKVVDRDGTLVEMNPAGLAMVEADRAEAVTGGCVYDLIAPESREAFVRFNERVCAGASGTLEFEVIGLRGTRRTMETHAVPLRAPDGRLRQLAITRDVTARRQAERVLRHDEALFRQLADSLPQIVWMARPDGCTDYYNERWYEFTGFARGEVGDASWTPIVHPDDVERSVATWHEAVRSGERYQIEYRFFDRRDGRYRWHLGRALPVRDHTGAVLRWFGTCTDIDDQKRAEQASHFLAQASRTLSSLADYPTALHTVATLAVPGFADWCAVDVLERDGSLRRLALAYWDPSKLAMAQELERRYPSRPIDAFGPRPVIRSGTAEMASEITDDMLVASAHDEEHLRLLRAAGLKSYVAVPVKSGGATVGAITFLTSDSGRRYGPADLALAEELAYRAGIALENARLYTDLQEAGRQKDEFLAVLAHELRNPLAPIRTALQLTRLAADDPARRERAFTVMDRQLQQLVRLVDDLLDVSRITRGRIELQREPVDLAGIIQSAVETSRPLFEAAGHELTVTYPREPVYLEADAMRLAQVFANLLNNAAKYTAAGGRISIAAERQGPHAVVRVRDTGIGIPAAMLTRIFDMFMQVDRSLEKTHGGLGIGLTLVKRLVELHGGTVEARSEGAGAGSELIVQLPAMAAAAQEHASGRGAVVKTPQSPPRRILVVDDNRDALDTLADMLAVSGHDVRTATDGVQALEAADAFRPDVVLLDLGMPRMNGFEAARHLRQRFGGDLLLVAVTGWGQSEDRQRSRQAGFDHHLVKPVDPAALDALLAGLTRRRI